MFHLTRRSFTTNWLAKSSPLRRNMSHFRIVEHTLRAQHIRDRLAAVKPGRAGDMRLAVKQYIPRDNAEPRAGDVTFIGTHANGFPKELYEPLWDDLYEAMRARGRRIRGIWIADSAHQGYSSVLNEGILGTDPSWFDHSRDLLRLINEYQDDMPNPIIGIGHSMGGTQLAHLALYHPSLFQALVLVDPVIQTENPSRHYALPSTYRRDIWPSREDAVKRWESNPVYQKWDPRVLEKLGVHGLRDLPTEVYPETEEHGDKAVTLTTPKVQELFGYQRPKYENGVPGLKDGEWRSEMRSEDVDDTYAFYRPEAAQIFHQLGSLKPSVLYLLGENSELSTPELRKKKLDATGTGVGGSGGVEKNRVKEKLLPTGHLVPMERVRECAEASASFSHDELVRWEKEVEYFQGEWNRTSRREKITVDERWKGHIGVLSKRGKL